MKEFNKLSVYTKELCVNKRNNEKKINMYCKCGALQQLYYFALN